MNKIIYSVLLVQFSMLCYAQSEITTEGTYYITSSGTHYIVNGLVSVDSDTLFYKINKELKAMPLDSITLYHQYHSGNGAKGFLLGAAVGTGIGFLLGNVIYKHSLNDEINQENKSESVLKGGIGGFVIGGLIGLLIGKSTYIFDHADFTTYTRAEKHNYFFNRIPKPEGTLIEY
jgi:hypothetical protein